MTRSTHLLHMWLKYSKVLFCVLSGHRSLRIDGIVVSFLLCWIGFPTSIYSMHNDINRINLVLLVKRSTKSVAIAFCSMIGSESMREREIIVIPCLMALEILNLCTYNFRFAMYDFARGKYIQKTHTPEIVEFRSNTHHINE